MNYEEFKNVLRKEMLVRDMQKAGYPIRLELTLENARKNISFSRLILMKFLILLALN